MKTNPTRALAVAAGLVIVALTAAAFWLSYAHLAEVALAHGMRGKEIRAWAWPATLDLFIVAGELLMLRAALAGRVDRWAIGLTVVGSGSSIALNVAGVGAAAEPLDYVVAAVPPTAALLAFGALMRQIHQALAGQVDVAEVTANRGDMTTVADLHGAEDHAVVTEAVTAPEPVEVVIPAASTLTAAPFMWEAVSAPKVTAALPAEQAREVVTEVIALTPSELRRKARALNRQAVKSTSRPVTIKTLQDELGLSRREATDLRREVVTEVAS
ncbi:DUF2637 domain-containing protein [Streptomyces nigra]|uniref:DUF2637 domain-containing protein n=1 Tax=Streptomyces nigra TaxID=1827580 RepID=UPI0034325D02